MYECPNCGGNLKYDIKSEKMKCFYCDSMFDPYEVKDKRKVEEHTENLMTGDEDGMMQVTVYTCPQCGGEIIGDENEAATFCSYCGASTMMEQRMDRAMRPVRIVPFKKTKDDCARAYKSLVSKAIFAPDYVKDPQKIESFRGIYMPYWVYDFSKKGVINYPAKHTYQRGDYEYTDHYRVTTNADIEYKGFNYDASSTFSDTLSNAIAPFNAEGSKDFTTAFMSGFYADVMDVDASVYSDDAEDAAAKHAAERIAGEQRSRKYTISKDSVASALNLSTDKSELNMMPVWFMSYRARDVKGEDRVLYSVVNGQTGKAAADLPVDVTKYVLGSAILALPIFALFNLFLVMTPLAVLVLATLIMAVCGFIMLLEANSVADWETGKEDQGLNFTKNKERLKKAEAKPKKKKKDKAPVKTEAEIKHEEIRQAAMKESQKGNRLLFWISLVVAFLLCIIRPINDAYFYIGVILTGITDCLMLIGIMKNYNRLTMRPLPQFKRKGGDDRADISKDI